MPCVQTDRRVLKQGEALTFRPHHGVAGHGSARGCNVRNAVVNEADARRAQRLGADVHTGPLRAGDFSSTNRNLS